MYSSNEAKIRSINASVTFTNQVCFNLPLLIFLTHPNGFIKLDSFFQHLQNIMNDITKISNATNTAMITMSVIPLDFSGSESEKSGLELR